ncbi:MAG TPA: hypothetical protein VNA25_13630 [Phycisphaerae bacterium]|nr:hypothetical protein [Phycisphaerae bacterium]
MHRFTQNDFRWLETCPISPQQIQQGISNLVYCSVNARANVESCNPDTGEYRIVLQGTLEINTPGYGIGSGPGF